MLRGLGLRLRPSPASYCRTASAPRTRLSVQFLFLAADPGEAPPRRGARREAPPAVVAVRRRGAVTWAPPHVGARTHRQTNHCLTRTVQAPPYYGVPHFLDTPEVVSEIGRSQQQPPYYEQTDSHHAGSRTTVTRSLDTPEMQRGYNQHQSTTTSRRTARTRPCTTSACTTRLTSLTCYHHSGRCSTSPSISRR